MPSPRHPLPLLLLLLTQPGCRSDDSGGDPTPDAPAGEDVVSGDLPGDLSPGDADTTGTDPNSDSAEPGDFDGSDAPPDLAVDPDPDSGPECPVLYAETDDPPDPPRHTPRWAFEPWISKDISSSEDTCSFVAGFRSRDIPVGVVVFDSPWETHYNTFVPNPSRYGGFEELVAELRADEIRVVLWITQMINQSAFDAEAGGDRYVGPSPNLATARDCGFLVNGGQTYYWWKGFGAGLDFFNPQAATWWHEQQRQVLAAGISGWKLDFGDEYIDAEIVRTAIGDVPRQQYSEAYYRDYLAWGVQQRGPEEFVTMVRPYDQSYGFPGRFYARPEHAPVGWVGDNRRDWIGLIDALDHIFRSAIAGYVVLGSDIGGYLDRDDEDLLEVVPFDIRNFLTWTAVGAMTPFMELHGRANLEPWAIGEDPEQTASIYRYWATLHHALVPFFYSLAEEAYAGGPQIIRPIGEETDWAGDWRYQLGDAFLVAPFLDGTSVRDVALPAGATWYDWWDPTGTPLAGGSLIEDAGTGQPDRIPIYVRSGAIVPLVIDSDALGLGDPAFAPFRTIAIWPDAADSHFTIHEAAGIVDVSARVDEGLTEVEFSSSPAPTRLRVLAPAPLAGVTLGESEMDELPSASATDPSAVGWWLEADRPFVWIALPASTGPLQVSIR